MIVECLQRQSPVLKMPGLRVLNLLLNEPGSTSLSGGSQSSVGRRFLTRDGITDHERLISLLCH
jgi:hypothetical protein